jgi:PqqD family protein of HPr-rel-A system
MSLYQRNSEIEEAPLQSELMLYHPGSSQFYMLNATMAEIWKLCVAAQPMDALVEGVEQAFEGAERATVEGDVKNAVGELVSLGILVDTASANA